MKFLYLLTLILLFTLSSVDKALAVEKGAKVSRENVHVTKKQHQKRSLKERIARFVLNKKLKKQQRKAAKGKQTEKKLDGLAMAGFGASLLSFFPGLALFLIIPAIVLSILGINRIKRSPETKSGKGFAIAGLIIGIALLIFYSAVVIAYAAGG